MSNMSKTNYSLRFAKLAIATSLFVFGVSPNAFAQDSESLNNISDPATRAEHWNTIRDPNASLESRQAACGALDMANCSEAQLGQLAGTSGPASASEDECKSDEGTAKMACLTPGADGMDAGTAAMYSMMVNTQLPTLAAALLSAGKNMSQQCKIQADIAKLQSMVNGVKGAACVTTVKSCSTSCEKEITRAQEAYTRYSSNTYTQERATAEKKKLVAAKGHLAKCGGYASQVTGMMFGAMQGVANMAVNKQCQSDLAALAVPTPTIPAIALPTIGDCTDPNNQSITCYCEKAANKASPMCAGFSPPTIIGGGGAVPGGGSVASPYTPAIADVGNGEGNTADPFAGNKSRGGGGNGPGDGGSGAPGGGGLSSLSSEGGGSGGGGDTKSAITGTSGGNGGLGSAGGGGGGSGGLARNNGGAGGGGMFDKFNLKKFLPGSKYKTRGIAGMSVKSVDGITGPTGPSIWEKATRQYQEQIQKQNVILEK